MNDQVSFRLIKGNKILNVTFNKMDKISDVEKEAETKLDYLHGLDFDEIQNLNKV